MIPKNSTVWIAYLAGNYAAAQFPEPGRLDIDHRENAGSHLTLGHGIHYCIGAALAKLESRLVLEELTRHYPSLCLEPGQDLMPVPNFILRTYQEMVLTINKPAEAISL
ncbi:MAG: cytochrome P450 [Oscillatoriophycideae cyanobacterium NC_groundwater_1537_Pr4_S-0.65um_50_18]|nr:cytochrome P450 [Oscillatoriophycideae cyanobacterium NC_groundwater_1537_Pr4_S-0.65um_50_18]